MNQREFSNKLVEAYQARFRLRCPFDKSDGIAVASLLKKEPDMTRLLESWQNFLATTDRFDANHHKRHPVRYWCYNCYQVYLPEATVTPQSKLTWPDEDEISTYLKIASIVQQETRGMPDYLKCKRQLEMLESEGLKPTLAYQLAKERV